MKSATRLSLALFLVFISCREKAPSIDLGSGAKTTDTTYVGAVEAPQKRNVLIEDFTGVSCPPCPGGHERLKAILAKYPGRVIITGNHIFGFPQAAPISGISRQDFRTQDATDIGNSFGGISFMPSAVIDRTPDGSGSYLRSISDWVTTVDNRIMVVSGVNISIASTWNESNRSVQARVKISYNESIVAKHNLTIAVIENKIIDGQKNLTTVDSFYLHNEVLRDVVTLSTGVPVLDSIAAKEPGRVFERSIVFNLDSKWNVDNCKIVAFVHYSGPSDKSVIQAIETDVK